MSLSYCHNVICHKVIVICCQYHPKGLAWLGHVNLYCFINFPPTDDTGLEAGGTASADHQVAAGKEDDPHVIGEANFAVHLLLHGVILSS